MADEDPFKEEHGISIEDLGFDPRQIRSQQEFEKLTDARKRLYSNIRYESTLPPEERERLAEKRRLQLRRAEREREQPSKGTASQDEIPPCLMVSSSKNIFIPIWDGFDQLSFSTMYDAFKQANFNVVVGVVRPSRVVPPAQSDLLARPQVRSKSGVFVSGDFLFDYRGNSNFLDFDAVVIPSGDGVKGLLLSNKKLVSLVKVLASRQKLVCGVEDVPGLLLLRLGILSKTRCAGSERSEDEILNSIPPELGRDVTFRKGESVVIDDTAATTVVTCRSAADSQECALTVIACLDASLLDDVAKKVGHEQLSEKVQKNFAAPTPRDASPLEGGEPVVGLKVESIDFTDTDGDTLTLAKGPKEGLVLKLPDGELLSRGPFHWNGTTLQFLNTMNGLVMDATPQPEGCTAISEAVVFAGKEEEPVVAKGVVNEEGVEEVIIKD